MGRLIRINLLKEEKRRAFALPTLETLKGINLKEILAKRGYILLFFLGIFINLIILINYLILSSKEGDLKREVEQLKVKEKNLTARLNQLKVKEKELIDRLNKAKEEISKVKKSKEILLILKGRYDLLLLAVNDFVKNMPKGIWTYKIVSYQEGRGYTIETDVYSISIAELSKFLKFLKENYNEVSITSLERLKNKFGIPYYRMSLKIKRAPKHGSR